MRKRFLMTFTVENVEECHRQLARLNLPKSALSAVLDDWMGNFVPILTRMADKKAQGQQMTFEEIMSDMFVSLGKAMKP